LVAIGADKGYMLSAVTQRKLRSDLCRRRRFADTGGTEQRNDTALTQNIARIQGYFLAQKTQCLAPALFNVIAGQYLVDDDSGQLLVDAAHFQPVYQSQAIGLVAAHLTPVELLQFAFEQHAQAAQFILNILDDRCNVSGLGFALPARSANWLGLGILAARANFSLIANAAARNNDRVVTERQPYLRHRGSHVTCYKCFRFH